MSKNKKLKLYTHNQRFLQLEVKNTKWPVKFFLVIYQKLFNLFYLIGNLLVKSAKFVHIFFKTAFIGLIIWVKKIFSIFFNLIKNDIRNSVDTLPKRFGQIVNRKFLKEFGLFFLAAAVVWAVLLICGVIGTGFLLKDNVVSSAKFASSYMLEAAENFKNSNLASAQDRLLLAEKFFSQSQGLLSGQGGILGQILKIAPQSGDAKKLLQAAQILTKSGQTVIALKQQASGLHISAAGLVSSGQNNAEILKNLNNGVAEIYSDINRVSVLLNQINPNVLPSGYKSNFLFLKDQLDSNLPAINSSYQIYTLVSGLITGQKNVLILFENNNELRATGGFMGTFGSLQMQDGQIKKINVSSIYDLDGQLKEKNIQPPLPLVAVSPAWFLRDSNWFADFPTSVRKIAEFYQKEGGQKPDIVIAMTPDIIVNWLKITGSIAMPKYGVTLTSDNFVEQTQAITTISDNMPTNSPKQMLADFIPLLIQKISSGDKNQLPQILQAFLAGLTNKQIAFYADNADTEKQINSFNWGGSLANSDRDYLILLDSNLGATKTSLNISQNYSLVSNIGSDGSITNELTINRANNNPKNEDMSNVSFLRVYVPLGSKLVSNSGFDKKDLRYPPDVVYQIDQDVYDWEKNSVTDNLTGTIIGQESGKTFFGNWITLDPKKNRTIKLTYVLPFKLDGLDRYSLTLQKQMGAVNSQFSWNINFSGRKILWKNFEPKSQKTAKLNSDIIVDKDYLLGVVLQK